MSTLVTLSLQVIKGVPVCRRVLHLDQDLGSRPRLGSRWDEGVCDTDTRPDFMVHTFKSPSSPSGGGRPHQSFQKCLLLHKLQSNLPCPGTQIFPNSLSKMTLSVDLPYQVLVLPRLVSPRPYPRPDISYCRNQFIFQLRQPPSFRWKLLTVRSSLLSTLPPRFRHPSLLSVLVQYSFVSPSFSSHSFLFPLLLLRMLLSSISVLSGGQSFVSFTFRVRSKLLRRLLPDK